MRTILKLKANSRKEAIDALNKALDNLNALNALDVDDKIEIRVSKLEKRNYKLFI